MSLENTPYDADALDERRELFITLQAAARKITLGYYKQALHVEDKSEIRSGYDPVTQADREAEEVLRDLIAAAFPDDTIEGEEFDDKPGTTGWLWTLDPIDGTRAFIAGVPMWSSLISLSWGDEPVVGLADFPALDEFFIGSPDGTWHQEGDTPYQVHCRDCAGLTEAVIACTEPHGMFTAGQMAAYKIIHRTTRFARLGLDSYGYCLLAAGHIDLVLEADLKPCDVRALIPIVTGAGGTVTGWKGESANFGGAVVALGDQRLKHETMMVLGRAL